MVFWVIWAIGICITIGTRIAINKLVAYGEEIYDKSNLMQTIMHILVMFCIFIVGGIANAKWLASLQNINIWGYIMAGFLPAILTYIVGYFILGLYHFDCGLSKTIFILTFIVSIVFWFFPINKYNQNIEIVNEVVKEQKQENKLLYFCNVPVQKISGDVSGSSFFGSGSVHGDISTYDQIPYWYLDFNNQGSYSSVSADASKLIFIENQDTPMVKIIDCCLKKFSVNHNNGKKKVVEEKNWTEYHFYVPKEIMQYNLN